MLQANLVIVAAAAQEGQTPLVSKNHGAVQCENPSNTGSPPTPAEAFGRDDGVGYRRYRQQLFCDNARRMNIGLFGGTFDPVHKGHLVVAHAAAERFQLGKIYFIPASLPPHRQQEPITAFHHRFAMLALATADEKKFLPSLAEAPSDQDHLSYTIDTVRRSKQAAGKSDHLFFIIGIDAFLQVASWHRAEDLLREIDFVVVSRPGFSLADVADALPKSMRPKPEVLKAFRKSPAGGTLALGGTTIHILDGVKSPFSATEVRRAAAGGKSLDRFVEPSVAKYIKKMGLYKAGSIRQETGDRKAMEQEAGSRRRARK